MSPHACLDRVLSYAADPSCLISREQIQRDADVALEFVRGIVAKLGDKPECVRKRLLLVDLAEVYEREGSYRRAEGLRAEAREIAKDCPTPSLEELMVEIRREAYAR